MGSVSPSTTRRPSRGDASTCPSLSPENDVEVFDAARRPVDFPATASYITDNKLTGTPKGPFGERATYSVDSIGDLFVCRRGQNVVDEFDSSGIFLRAFPAPGGEIPAGRPGPDQRQRPDPA